MRAVAWRTSAIAVGFGAVAGIAASTLRVMHGLQDLVWGVGDAWWYLVLAILGLIGRVGSAAALSGLYGSPPGGTAVVGLAGFLLTSALLGGLDVPPLDLPPYLTSHNGTDLLRAVAPALAAALGAAAYTAVRPVHAHLVGRLRSTTAQTLVATAVFAGLAVLWPILRFSGHSEFPQPVSMAGDAAWWSLLGVGLLELLACAVCLAGGYRGGQFFPLMFSGAAVGVATVAIVPGLQVTGALVAGLAAATAVGLKKPVAALLIGLFVVQGAALGPLVVGVAVGVVVLKVLGRFGATDRPTHAHA